MSDSKYVRVELQHFIKDDSKQVSWGKSEKRKWLVALFSGCAMAYSSRLTMPLCISKISRELNWDKKQQGMVLGSFFWGYTLTQILGGYLSDRIGGEIVLVIGAIGWAAVTFMTPILFHVLYGSDVLLQNLKDTSSVALGIVILSRIMCGAFQGVHFPTLTSILSRNVPIKERAFSYSITVSGSQMGMMFTGVLGSLLMQNYRWTSIFYFIGLLSLTWVVIVKYSLVNEALRKKNADVVGPPSKSGFSSPTSVPWATLAKHKAFWVMLFGHLCHTNSFFILTSWIPSYLHDTFPEQKGWVSNIVPYLITIPCSIIGGWSADKLIANDVPVIRVRKVMETLSLCGTALSLLVLCVTTTYSASLTCLCIALGCCALHNSAISVNVQDIAPRYSGSVFGLMNTAGAIPGFVGVYAVGYVLETSGDQWYIVFVGTAVLCVIGLVFYLLYGSAKPIV